MANTSAIALIGARLICLCLWVVVSACSQYQPLPDTQAPRQHSLPTQWLLKAKLGMRTPTKSGSVTLNWQQTDSRYLIQVQAPLGQGSATLRGNKDYMVVEQPGKPPHHTHDPNTLVAETFGWTLPITHLGYWLRGSASPEAAITAAHYSEQGVLTQLQQAQWTLSFSRHQQVEHYRLPRRILARRQDTQLTLIIREWELP